MLDKEKNENSFLNFLNEKNIEYQKKFELKHKSWIKAGGIFELYIQPKSLLEI